MKFFIILTIFLVSNNSAFSQYVIPTDWKLSAKQAKGMIQFYNDCSGNCFNSKATPDTAKENLIRVVFKNAKSIAWIDARYRSEDVSKYTSRNWQISQGTGGQVNGYTTKILKVVDEDESIYYFDIVSICPPPSPCDTVESENGSGQ